MKKQILSLLAICLLALQPLAAQTASDYLDNVVDGAQDVTTFASANKNALDVLRYEFNVQNNPNVANYLNLMTNYQGVIEAASDDIIQYATFAANLDPSLNVASIISKAGQIEALEDGVQNKSQELAGNINSNKKGKAKKNFDEIHVLLDQQIALANMIESEANALQATISQTFDVRIELVDNNGNPITGSTGLQGYWAYDQAAGQYIYPDYYSPDEFTDLNAGTYTFGAFDGYFDGASSEVVTLSSSLVGNDGFIVVQLVYWSE